MKLFYKEAGVPKAVIGEPSPNQKSDKVRQFYHKVGTTLRVLEALTQPSDRAKLYARTPQASLTN